VALRASTGENVGEIFWKIRRRKREMVGGCDLLEACMGGWKFKSWKHMDGLSRSMKVRKFNCTVQDAWGWVYMCVGLRGFEESVWRGAGRCVG